MNKVIEFNLSNKVYNLEAILNTCYIFVDRAYIFLDSDSKGERISVALKIKKKASQKQIKQIEGEFTNNLLHNNLRYKINKNNKKITEYIVSAALYSSLSDADTVNSFEKLDYQEDPLGIAIPWEEKYGKKKSKRKKNASAKV